MVFAQGGTAAGLMTKGPEWRVLVERVMAQEMVALLNKQTAEFIVPQKRAMGRPMRANFLLETADFIRGIGLTRAAPIFMDYMRGRYRSDELLDAPAYAAFCNAWREVRAGAAEFQPPPPLPLSTWDALMLLRDPPQETVSSIEDELVTRIFDLRFIFNSPQAPM